MRVLFKYILIAMLFLLTSCGSQRYHHFSKVKVKQISTAQVQAPIVIGLINSKSALPQKALVALENAKVSKIELMHLAPSAHVVSKDFISSHHLVDDENEIASKTKIESRGISKPSPQKGHLAQNGLAQAGLIFGLAAIITPLLTLMIALSSTTIITNSANAVVLLIFGGLVFPTVFAILAVIFSSIALSRINPLQQEGKPAALGGLILGCIVLFLLLLLTA